MDFELDLSSENMTSFLELEQEIQEATTNSPQPLPRPSVIVKPRPKPASVQQAGPSPSLADIMTSCGIEYDLPEDGTDVASPSSIHSDIQLDQNQELIEELEEFFIKTEGCPTVVDAAGGGDVAVLRQVVLDAAAGHDVGQAGAGLHCWLGSRLHNDRRAGQRLGEAGGGRLLDLLLQLQEGSHVLRAEVQLKIHELLHGVVEAAVGGAALSSIVQLVDGLKETLGNEVPEVLHLFQSDVLHLDHLLLSCWFSLS